MTYDPISIDALRDRLRAIAAAGQAGAIEPAQAEALLTATDPTQRAPMTHEQPARPVAIARGLAAIRQPMPEAPDLRSVDSLAAWIERVRSAAFFGGARHEEISLAEAEALVAILALEAIPDPDSSVAGKPLTQRDSWVECETLLRKHGVKPTLHEHGADPTKPTHYECQIINAMVEFANAHRLPVQPEPVGDAELRQLVSDLRTHAADDCDGQDVPTHIANIAAGTIERLAALSSATPSVAGMESLRKLSDRATPGPWCWEQCGDKCDDPVVGLAFAADDENGERPYAGRLIDENALRYGNIAYGWESCEGCTASANAEFAVACVNHVRASLLATPPQQSAMHEGAQAERARNDGHLIGLLRREGTYSDVWFADKLLEAADRLAALSGADGKGAGR